MSDCIEEGISINLPKSFINQKRKTMANLDRHSLILRQKTLHDSQLMINSPKSSQGKLTPKVLSLPSTPRGKEEQEEFFVVQPDLGIDQKQLVHRLKTLEDFGSRYNSPRSYRKQRNRKLMTQTSTPSKMIDLETSLSDLSMEWERQKSEMDSCDELDQSRYSRSKISPRSSQTDLLAEIEIATSQALQTIKTTKKRMRMKSAHLYWRKNQRQRTNERKSYIPSPRLLANKQPPKNMPCPQKRQNVLSQFRKPALVSDLLVQHLNIHAPQ